MPTGTRLAVLPRFLSRGADDDDVDVDDDDDEVLGAPTLAKVIQCQERGSSESSSCSSTQCCSLTKTSSRIDIASRKSEGIAWA